MSGETWWWFNDGHGCGALITRRGGWIVGGAPIFRRYIGINLYRLMKPNIGRYQAVRLRT